MLSKLMNSLVELMPMSLPYQWCESKFANEGLTKRKQNALLAVYYLFIYFYHSGVANLVVVNGGDARGGSREVFDELISQLPARVQYLFDVSIC